MQIKNIIRKNNIKKYSMEILIVLFSIVSFYTSYTGLLKLSGVSDNDTISKIFFAVIVLGLQIALVMSINAFYIRDLFRKYWIKSLSLLMVYVITMSFSVAFSFSFWYGKFSAENFAKTNSNFQLNSVKSNLYNAKNSFETMKNTLSELSAYSANMSRLEETRGRTCDKNVGSGYGWFTQLRADDAVITKELSENINSLKNRLDDDIKTVTKFIDEYNPKKDVKAFNQKVNSYIKQINSKYFQNPILQDIKSTLINRSGVNRNSISVTLTKDTKNGKWKKGDTKVTSCPDIAFDTKVKRVISSINSLKPVKPLEFFDLNDTNRLFNRTLNVLFALFNPSYKIKKSNEITDPNDVTFDDISAVSAGFVIDFLILLIAIIAKEPKADTLPLKKVKQILNGEYTNEVLGSIRKFMAELHKKYLLAIPKDVNSEEIDNVNLFLQYMVKHGMAKLYINEIDIDKLDRYFNNNLQNDYPNSKFKVYQLDKKKFNNFILQNIEKGDYYV